MEIATGILIGVVLVAFCIAIVNRNEYPYSYHVAYNFGTKDGGNGFGTMNVRRNRKINNSTEVKTVQEFIEKETGFKTIVVLNWILLK